MAHATLKSNGKCEKGRKKKTNTENNKKKREKTHKRTEGNLEEIKYRPMLTMSKRLKNDRLLYRLEGRDVWRGIGRMFSLVS